MSQSDTRLTKTQTLKSDTMSTNLFKDNIIILLILFNFRAKFIATMVKTTSYYVFSTPLYAKF